MSWFRRKKEPGKWELTFKQAVAHHGGELNVIKEFAKDLKPEHYQGLMAWQFLLIKAVAELEFRLRDLEVRKQ